MTTVFSDKKVQGVGSWQQSFVPTYSERVKKAKKRATQTAEICIEHARAEIKAFEQYKNEPRIIQRARFLETYLIQANVDIRVKQTIPDHVGLGSGTQLALAVATALKKIFNVKASTQELAIAMGRAQRTGVGTAIFFIQGY